MKSAVQTDTLLLRLLRRLLPGHGAYRGRTYEAILVSPRAASGQRRSQDLHWKCRICGSRATVHLGAFPPAFSGLDAILWTWETHRSMHHPYSNARYLIPSRGIPSPTFS